LYILFYISKCIYVLVIALCDNLILKCANLLFFLTIHLHLPLFFYYYLLTLSAQKFSKVKVLFQRKLHLPYLLSPYNVSISLTCGFTFGHVVFVNSNNKK